MDQAGIFAVLYRTIERPEMKPGTFPGDEHMRTRKLALALALTLASAAAAPADDYPTRPIRLIVPFAAGGAADSVARIIGKRVGDALG